MARGFWSRAAVGMPVLDVKRWRRVRPRRLRWNASGSARVTFDDQCNPSELKKVVDLDDCIRFAGN